MNWKEQISADIQNVLGTLLMYKLPAEKSSPSPSSKSDGLGDRQLVLFINSSTCLSNTNLTFWRLPLKKEKKMIDSLSFLQVECVINSLKNQSSINWGGTVLFKKKRKKKEPDARSFFQSTGSCQNVSLFVFFLFSFMNPRLEPELSITDSRALAVSITIIRLYL